MSVAIESKLTLEEFLALPENKPASEFFHGEITQKVMPQGEHSLIQTTFLEVVNGVARTAKTAIGFPELRCTFGGASIVPDVAVFRWERIPKMPSGKIAKRFEISPDWSVEILSPNQKLKKVLANLLHCSRNGTELGWLINPEEEIVLAVFPGQRVELYESGSLPILEGINLELTVEQIFSWLTLN